MLSEELPIQGAGLSFSSSSGNEGVGVYGKHLYKAIIQNEQDYTFSYFNAFPLEKKGGGIGYSKDLRSQ